MVLLHLTHVGRELGMMKAGNPCQNSRESQEEGNCLRIMHAIVKDI